VKTVSGKVVKHSLA